MAWESQAFVGRRASFVETGASGGSLATSTVTALDVFLNGVARNGCSARRNPPACVPRLRVFGSSLHIVNPRKLEHGLRMISARIIVANFWLLL